jgi:hypothetical protein
VQPDGAPGTLVAVERDDVDIIRADPLLRRRLLLVLLGVVGVGAAAIQYAPGALHEIFRVARESPAEAERQARILMFVLLGPIALLSLVAGIDVVRTAFRALEARCFPPPGTRVLRDTPVIRGSRARLIGAVALTLGLALVCAAATLSWLGYRVAAELRQGCPRRAAQRARGGCGISVVRQSQSSSAQRTIVPERSVVKDRRQV